MFDFLDKDRLRQAAMGAFGITLMVAGALIAFWIVTAIFSWWAIVPMAVFVALTYRYYNNGNKLL